MSSRINTLHLFFAVLAITLCFFMVPVVAQAAETPANNSGSSSMTSTVMGWAKSGFSKGFEYIKNNRDKIGGFFKSVFQKAMAGFNKPAASASTGGN